jgi:hypothetical protein
MDVTPAMARENPSAYMGQSVIWAGVIGERSDRNGGSRLLVGGLSIELGR